MDLNLFQTLTASINPDGHQDNSLYHIVIQNTEELNPIRLLWLLQSWK